MAEGKPGRPRVLIRRQVITLSPELDEQVDKALEIAHLKTLLKPVEATLGNPVAFPLIVGLLAITIGVVTLLYLFPKLPDTDFPVVTVRDAADSIARWIKEHDPIPPVGTALETAVRVLGEALFKIWDGITKLPPIL